MIRLSITIRCQTINLRKGNFSFQEQPSDFLSSFFVRLDMFLNYIFVSYMNECIKQSVFALGLATFALGFISIFLALGIQVFCTLPNASQG